MKKNFTLFFLAAGILCISEVKAANASVSVADFAFTPQAVTINVGESVTWNWVNGTHPTQSDSNPPAWATFTLGPGNTSFTQVFTTPGTYPYHCTVHGPSMSGTITVLSPTGLNDGLQKHKLLEISPNPANYYLNINLQWDKPGNYDLRVTNAIGKTVKIIPAAELKLSNSHEIQMNLSDIPAGIYFFTLWNKDRIVENRRLVIAR